MKLLIKTEFKRNLRSLIMWSVIVVGLSILMLSLFPAFGDSFSMLEDWLGIFPEGFLKVFGLGPGGLNINDAYGWFGMEGYLFVVLIGGSYAGILGSSILSKEEDDKTIEFLLSKPISRTQILLGKGLVVVANLLILNILMFGMLSVTFLWITDYNFITILMLCIGPFFLQMIFASIAMTISVFITKSRMVISASLGLVIGLYFLNVIATLTDKLNFLKYFTPYEYVNAVAIVNENKIDLIYILLGIGAILLSSFITWIFYKKKDITI